MRKSGFPSKKRQKLKYQSIFKMIKAHIQKHSNHLLIKTEIALNTSQHKLQ